LLLYWPSDSRVLNNISAGHGCDDPVEIWSYNESIFFLILDTSEISLESPMMCEIYRPYGRDNRMKKQKKTGEEKMKKTEEEKISMEFFEEDEEDVSRNFKPAGFLQFQNGADTLCPV
jgi:hypothetical protein